MLQFRKDPPTTTKMGVAIFTLASLYLFSQHQQESRPRKELQIVPLLTIIIIIDVFFLFVHPISQPQSYHNFADKRIFICPCHSNSSYYSRGLFLPSNDNERRMDGFLSIPNFGDVVSNLVILAGGIWGAILTNVAREEYNDFAVEDMDSTRQWQLTICLPILFYATIFTSFGSTYYHWSPTNQSLVWDRLPMTLAFVSVFCFMLEEYTTFGIGVVLLFPLIGIGVFSIIYWKWTDDLRLYALVQFLPLLVIAWLVAAGDPKHGGWLQHVLALTFYAAVRIGIVRYLN